jgi:acetyl-CoA C-acetyltransferase
MDARLRDVSIVGIGQVAVQKKAPQGLRELAATVVRDAMQDAHVEHVDALYVSNMLSDELQSQKHLGALFADQAGLAGVEAFQVRAATASGAAALRVAYLAVASGEVDLAVTVGAEKMSEGVPTPVLAKALDARSEVPDGMTLISQNARLMYTYFQKYRPPEDALVNFPVVAHRNALNNPYALFNDRHISAEDVLASRLINPPIRLLDCSPVCDGAAAVILAPRDQAGEFTDNPVDILASSVATDRFRLDDRADPLELKAARLSAQRAFTKAGIDRSRVSFFEVHDAFSIMACLLLEAAGFAEPGQGWRLAAEGETALDGSIPITTMGGLKARGHPIGGTALYQTCEIVLQLTGRAGKNQLPAPEIGMMQSVGGVASTVLTHLFRAHRSG